MEPTTTNHIQRAVVLATNNGDFEIGLSGPFGRLVDRPFVQHVIESLVERKVEHIDFIISCGEAEFSSLVGDATRFGVQFAFHSVRDSDSPFSRLKAIFFREDTPFFLVDANLLEPAHWTGESKTAIYCWTDDEGETQWSGAAKILPGDIKSLTLDQGLDPFFDSLLTLQSNDDYQIETTGEPLRCHTFKDLLNSQERVLKGEIDELTRFGKEAEPGIWIQRNVYLNPRAKFKPPVFIHSNSQVDGCSTLGPNLVIAEGCYIDGQCELQHSLLNPNVLVGEGLDVQHCILDEHRLYNTAAEVALYVEDELIVGSTRDAMPSSKRIRRMFSKVVASLIVTFFAPILFIIACVQRFRFGSAFEYVEVVRLPTTQRNRFSTFLLTRFRRKDNESASVFKHFFMDLLPGLLNVVRGEVGWVGVSPLDRTALSEMPSEWQDVYKQADLGLISEATLNYGYAGSKDERLIADIYFASTKPYVLGRLIQMACYIKAMFLGARTSRASRRDLPAGKPGAIVPSNIAN